MPDQKNIRKLWLGFMQISIAVVIGAILWFATPNGLGLTPDSIAYIKAAQGLGQGVGFDYFSMQWPAGYSSLIFLAGKLANQDYLQAARIINVALYPLIFLIITKVLEVSCRLKKVSAIIFSLLICMHPVVSNVFFYALSESIFLIIVVIDVAMLIHYVTHNKSISMLFRVALIFLGCTAVMFRYAGITVVALNIWVILMYTVNLNGLRNKFLEILLQILPVVFIVGSWRLHRGVGDTEANERPLILHMITSEEIRYGLMQIGRWFVTSTPAAAVAQNVAISISYITGVVVFTSIVFLYLWSTFKSTLTYRKAEGFKEVSLLTSSILISSTFICGYVFFLIVIRCLFDPNIVLDNRTISPIFIPIIITYISILNINTKGKYKSFFYLLIILTMLVQASDFKSLIYRSYYNGLELNDKNHKTRPIIEFIKKCQGNIRISTDKPWSFNLFYPTMVYWLPTYLQYGSGLINSKYQEQINLLTMTKDVLIVEDTNSAIVESIDALKIFKRKYSSLDGIVWMNTYTYENFCK